MKLIITDTGETAKAIASAYPEDETKIVVFSKSIEDEIKNIRWTELCVAVSDENRAVIRIDARKEYDENSAINVAEIYDWIIDLRWRYITPIEIKIDIVSKQTLSSDSDTQLYWSTPKGIERITLVDAICTLFFPSETIINLSSEDDEHCQHQPLQVTG